MARVDALPVTTDSDCPAAMAVQAEVRELTTPEQRRAVPTDAKVDVSDAGTSIRIAITRDGKTSVRLYRDDARDCARRAHFVSVLVVVALMPPDLGVDAPPTPPPEPPPPPPPPHAEPPPVPAPVTKPRSRPVRIELAARGDVSVPIGDSVRVAVPSGALGVALGTGALRLTLATGFAPRTELHYTGDTAGRASLSRLDLALGLRWPFVRAPLEASVDASLVLVRQEMEGRSPVRPERDTAFSAGGRVGLRGAWSAPELLSPFLGVYVSAFPFAPAISQLPQGTVGHLPYVWLGLSGGLALAL